MSGTINKKAFSLFELLIVIAVVGILAGGITVAYRMQQSRHERALFLQKLNAMTLFAWQQAVMTNKIHRIVFDFKNRRSFVQRATGKGGDQDFESIEGGYVPARLRWSKTLEVKQFIIDGTDEIGKGGAARRTTEVWFYLFAQGLTQRVTINLVESSAGTSKKQIGLVLNIFNAQFKIYDTFQQ